MTGLVDRLRRLDGFQQRHRRLSFVVAVIKRFADDAGGQYAGLIAYHAFFTLFALLLAFVTGLGLLLNGDAGLQHRIVGSTLTQFPVIGTQIQRNVQSLHVGGIGLVVGIAGTLFSGLGVTRASQTAFDRIWEVSERVRYPFLRRQARGLGLLAILGVANLAATGLAAAADAGSTAGAVATIGALILSFAITFGLFMAAFSLLTSAPTPWRDLVPGAVIATVAWQLLQHLGGWFVYRHLRHASEVYGTFGLVIGLLTWFYIGAVLTLLAAEVNVVRARGLWPRSFL